MPDDLFHLGAAIQQDSDIGWYIVGSHREHTGIIGNTRIRGKNKAKYGENND
jgi:hypothetical protein